ncbi:MAG TPA: M67 family metallopeptidase [Dehalococcoidia bacterium]|nr:M67 family metallopeptidase [Dehalococcoidia bacterium]
MLRLPQEIIEGMIDHAREEFPLECCGMLAGKNGSPVKQVRATNSEASEFRYRVDDRELLRFLRECDENEWDFLAVYHSHTRSEAYPSPTDVRLARNWPDPYYILVSLENEEAPVVRAYRIEDGDITEEDLG